MPRISILMGAYNAEKTIGECVESIQHQTMPDWEMIIWDDGSQDGTLAVAGEYAEHDRRIRIFRNETNRGLTYCLNRAHEVAQGDYIARQDADDRSVPDRFEKQIEFLDTHPKIAFVSSSLVLFDESGHWGVVQHVAQPSALDFVARSPFAHAPTLMRKNALLSVGGYRDILRTRRVEDYDLWFRLYEAGYVGYNLKEPLYEVRDDRDARARRKFRYRINECVVKIEGYRRLRIPPHYYIFALRPLVVGAVPSWLYVPLRTMSHSKAG